MEPFSIYEVTATVLKVSWKLYKFFKAIQDAPEEVKEYLTTLESIRRVFQEVREYAAMHQNSEFRLQDGLQLSVVEPALKDCELEFTLQLSFIESLDPDATSSFFSRSRKRTEWVLRKETIEGLTRKLEKLQDLLNLALASSSGKNHVMLRQKLEVVSLEVHELHQSHVTEVRDRQQFLTTLQQYIVDLQRGTSSYLQLANEAHIRSDSRLNNMAESLAADLNSVTADDASGQNALQASQVGHREDTTSSSTLNNLTTPSEVRAHSSNEPSTPSPPSLKVDGKSVIGEAIKNAMRRFQMENPDLSFSWNDVHSANDIQAMMWDIRKGEAFRNSQHRISRMINRITEYSSLGGIALLTGLTTILNSSQEAYQACSRGLKEVSDVALICERKSRLYRDPRLYELIGQTYYQLLQAMGLCLKHYKQSNLQIIASKSRFVLAFEECLGEIRRLSEAILREVDYQHRMEMRETSSRVAEIQLEQHKIMSTLEDQKRILDSLQEERKIMNLVYEQQKTLQIVQQIQATLSKHLLL